MLATCDDQGCMAITDNQQLTASCQYLKKADDSSHNVKHGNEHNTGFVLLLEVLEKPWKLILDFKGT